MQYALLYQIFRDFNVTASKAPASYSHPEQQAMAKEAARLLTGFAAAPAATIDGYPEDLKLSPQEVAQARQGLRELQKDLIEYRNLTGDTTFLALGMTVANPRAGYAEYDRALAKTEARRTRRDIAILAQQFLLRKLSSGITAEVLRANLVDTTRSVEIYVRAAVRTPPGWVKTPSVVLSSFVGGNLVGGHNLDSAVTRYAVSPEVPAGKVAVTEVGGQRVIRVNPADADRIPAMLRTAATSREAPAVLARNLALEMRAAEPVPASRAVALMLPKRLAGGSRRPYPRPRAGRRRSPRRDAPVRHVGARSRAFRRQSGRRVEPRRDSHPAHRPQLGHDLHHPLAQLRCAVRHRQL